MSTPIVSPSGPEPANKGMKLWNVTGEAVPMPTAPGAVGVPVSDGIMDFSNPLIAATL